MQVLTHIDDQLSGCAGRPFQSVKYKVKLQDGERGHTGELLVKSAAMHIGRMVDGMLVPPELDEERYFSTGDIARLEGGKLWPQGRRKDVITGENGEKIFPDELECAFADAEEVEQLCVFGFMNKDNKEEIALVVYANRIRIDRNKMERIILALAKMNEKLPMKNAPYR